MAKFTEKEYIIEIYVNLLPFLSDLTEDTWLSGEDLCRHAVSKGFDGIEVNFKAGEDPETAWVLTGLSESPVSYHSSYQEFNLCSSNPYIRNAAVAQLKAEFMTAENNNGKALTFHPGWAKKISRQAALDNLWRSLDSFFSWAAPGVCRICLENMDNTTNKLCNSVDEIKQTVDRFPNLLLTCDVAHLGLQDMDPEKFIINFSEKIGHIHASGYRSNTRHSKVSLHESEIDFAPVFRHFRGRDIVVAIENRTWSLAEETRNFILSSIE